MNLNESLNALIASFVLWLPRVLVVLGVLIVGYIVALILQSVTRGHWKD